MEKNPNLQPAAPQPKFDVSLCRRSDGTVLVSRLNCEFATITAFLAVMNSDTFVDVTLSSVPQD